MIGLTSYRDYFSDGLIKQKKSLKTESLYQFTYDVQEIFDEPVKIVPTRSIFDEDCFAEFSKLVVFDHPMSLITQSKLTGFTTANLHHHAELLRKLIEYDKPKYLISSKAHELGQWTKTYASRADSPKEYQGKLVPWPSVAKVESMFGDLIDVTKDFYAVRQRPRAIFGDSHSTMLWAPGWTCYNIFGATLYRALSEGLDSYANKSLDSAIFCFGNIDLRYHLCRRPDPMKATIDLAQAYVHEASKVAPEVSVCSLLPVTREIPGIMKSYLYKKEQYFGTFEERMKLREVFRDELLASVKGTNVTILDPPSLFEDESGYLDEDCREVRGVHICPSKFQYCLSSGSSESRPQYKWTPA